MMAHNSVNRATLTCEPWSPSPANQYWNLVLLFIDGRQYWSIINNVIIWDRTEIIHL